MQVQLLIFSPLLYTTRDNRVTNQQQQWSMLSVITLQLLHVEGLAETMYEVDKSSDGILVCVELKSESQDCVVPLISHSKLQISQMYVLYSVILSYIGLL